MTEYACMHVIHINFYIKISVEQKKRVACLICTSLTSCAGPSQYIVQLLSNCGYLRMKYNIFLFKFMCIIFHMATKLLGIWIRIALLGPSDLKEGDCLVISFA